jgi:hypothetical protein
MAVGETSTAPTQNGHAEQPAAAADANHVKKSKADKKKEKRQKYKQNKQQRRWGRSSAVVGMQCCMCCSTASLNLFRPFFCRQESQQAAEQPAAAPQVRPVPVALSLATGVRQHQAACTSAD